MHCLDSTAHVLWTCHPANNPPAGYVAHVACEPHGCVWSLESNQVSVGSRRWRRDWQLRDRQWQIFFTSNIHLSAWWRALSLWWFMLKIPPRTHEQEHTHTHTLHPGASSNTSCVHCAERSTLKRSQERFMQKKWRILPHFPFGFMSTEQRSSTGGSQTLRGLHRDCIGQRYLFSPNFVYNTSN